MTSREWEVLYIVGLMTCVIVGLMMTFVDIARRPPGRRMTEAWANPSPIRAAALIGFFALILLGMIIWPNSGR